MIYLLALCLIAMCSILDRTRGDKKITIISNYVEACLMGICLSALAFINDTPEDYMLPLGLLFGLMYGLTEKPGWGEPLSAALYGREMRKKHLEKWQVGPLAKNTYLALIARGAIWGSPALIMMYWYEQFFYVFVAQTIAMSASIAITRIADKKITFKNSWQVNEYIRGAMVGLLTFGFGLS